MRVKIEILAIVLAAVIISVPFSSLRLVLADYTVGHASFPPDLPGDVNNDAKVDISDTTFVSIHYGSSFGGANWDPRADVNDDGTVNIVDVSAVAKLVGTNYNMRTTSPRAYSTNFKFDVPSTGVSGVWYYVLARIYVPSGLQSNTCFLLGSSSAGIKNVKIDTVLAYSNQPSGSFNIPLGNLAQGYHLLELSCLGPAGGGSLNFWVKTSAGEAIWLDRFRVCVPSFSSTTRSYTVYSYTYFSLSDRYFIKGFASDCIDEVKLGGGWLYQDWQWEWTAAVEHNGWGDGFNVPTGKLDPAGPRSIQFRYNATNGGTLDFAVVSFTDQIARVARGTPEFWSSVQSLPPLFGTMSNRTLYAGSTWYGDPGVSERKIIVSQQFYVAKYAYNGGPLLWDAIIRFDVSIARLDAAINAETSFAIALNVTYLGGVIKPAGSVRVTLVDTNVRVPSKALNVRFWEFKDTTGGKSIVTSAFKIVMGMTIAALVALCSTSGGPIGALFGVTGVLATGLLDFLPGTTEAGFSYSNTDTEADSLIEDMGDVGIGKSKTQISFVRVKPMQPTHCGMVRVQVDCYISGARVWTWIDFPVYDFVST